MRTHIAVLLAVLGLACDDASAPPAPADVAVAFASAATTIEPGEPLILDGGNGTLRVDSILLLVGRVRIEAGEDACTTPTAPSCITFGDVGLVPLPLTFDPHVVRSATVADPTRLTTIRFEVRPLGQLEEAVVADVRAARPLWPDSAAALVTGTFRRPGELPIPYRSYVLASFELGASIVGSAPRADALTFIIAANPLAWFSRPKGEVLELSYFDHSTTGRFVDLRQILEDGFVGQVFVR